MNSKSSDFKRKNGKKRQKSKGKRGSKEKIKNVGKRKR